MGALLFTFSASLTLTVRFYPHTSQLWKKSSSLTIKADSLACLPLGISLPHHTLHIITEVKLKSTLQVQNPWYREVE